MQSTKTTINAIHEFDLEGFLDKLGLLENLKNGNMKCGICGDVLTLPTIGAIFMDGDAVKLACNKPHCYHEALKKDISQ